MQMKIVIESEADFKKWLSDKPTLVSAVKAEKEPKPETVGPTAPLDTTKAAADTTKVVAAN
ncbi:hypothetical protein D9M72_631720 [compost metagenome]